MSEDREQQGYLTELRKDVREWRNIILSELKERYAEDLKNAEKLSNLELKITSLENSIQNLDVKYTDLLNLIKEGREKEEVKRHIHSKGKYAIVAAAITAIGAIVSAIFGFLNYFIIGK